MAKKILWKDNTEPPTNYLWLKMGLDGAVQGLYEWNGRRWTKISSGSDTPTTGSITFTDLEGESYVVTGLKELESGFGIVDSEGETVGTFVSMEYLTNNYSSNETIEEKVIQIIQENPCSLSWIEDTVEPS